MHGIIKGGGNMVSLKKPEKPAKLFLVLLTIQGETKFKEVVSEEEAVEFILEEKQRVLKIFMNPVETHMKWRVFKIMSE